jgi:hypothetical protein
MGKGFSYVLMASFVTVSVAHLAFAAGPCPIVDQANTFGFQLTEDGRPSDEATSGPFAVFSGSVRSAVVSIGATDQATRDRINEYSPKPKWDLGTGLVHVDMTFVRDQVVPAYTAIGYSPDGVFLEVDGDSKHLISVDSTAAQAQFQAGKTYRQLDVKVVLKRNGKEIFVSDPGMIEDMSFPRVDPASLGDFPTIGLKQPDSLLKNSDRAKIQDPVRLATELERGIIQVTINPDTRNSLLKARFHDHGSQLKFELVDGKWKVTDTVVGDVIPVEKDDVQAFPNAAFNWNLFKWDGDIVNRALSYNDPELAENWINARYEIQKIQGSGLQPREIHASNLVPYQRVDNVKLGETKPEVTPNGEFVNPPLTGFAFQELYRWYPKMGKDMVEKMIEMSRKEREALVRSYGVSGKGHAVLGFVWTNLGSGRDNAPRCLGQPGCLAVDMITYYKMMLDQEAEFSEYLGKWDDAKKLQAESKEIADVINKEYWNPDLGIYTDLIKKDENTTEHSQIRTMVGFWPMMAGVPEQAKIDRMIQENLHNPKRFGDGPFPPSVAADHAGQVDANGKPLYDPAGSYWRGGFWPPDELFLDEGLWVNGRRAEAEKQFNRAMGGVAEASLAYQAGDSPYALVHGSPSPDEAALMKKQGVFWEAYGRVPDPKTGQLRPTFNRQYTPNGLHMTRPNLGWSLALPVSGLKYEEGLDAVPAFLGSDRDLAHWMRELVTNPIYQHQQVAQNPALARVISYLKTTSSPNALDLNRLLANDPEAARQVALLKNGYLEVSPSFDPGNGKTEIDQLRYNGVSFTLQINRVSGSQIQLVVKSDQAIPLQFNRNWTGTGASSHATDQAHGSSPIVELGGNQGVPVRLADGSEGRAVTIELPSE